MKKNSFLTQSVVALILLLSLHACKNPKPIEKQAGSSLAISEIEQEIKNYISLTTQENEGFFPVKDENHDLKMKLVRVHT